MGKRTLIQVPSFVGVIAAIGAIGAVGCFANDTEETSDGVATTSHVTAQGDTSAVLKSTLVFETGCSAAKIGPKVLLTAARCVVGNAKFTTGATVKFTVAAAAAATDAGARAQVRSLVVSDVKVHSSFGAHCTSDACAVGKDASDAADIAVVILDEDLETVPSIPIDLDTVGEADPLLAISTGCSKLDGKDGTASPRTAKTIAVPAAAAAHDGSPYATSASTTKLAGSYVVTAGIGWQASGTKICASDIGAPLFRAGSSAIAGVTSTITTFDDTLTPVTIEHARVDAVSRFKIADWLDSFGALTIHSCSESAGGCQTRSYDGGLPQPAKPAKDTTGPDEDAGAEVDATAPDAGPSAPFDNTPPDTTVTQDPGPSAGDYGDEDYGDAAVPAKKTKKKAAGCSAAPGNSFGESDMGLGLAIALGTLFVRRRRRGNG